ncbi:MAG: two pore domain potassium channel family protein [Candidatus Wildermuthbacteria bacterium]|nr:two pore domain potassium channel family protein [Candidatus Wildermuthbacteria bacterium]
MAGKVIKRKEENALEEQVSRFLELPMIAVTILLIPIMAIPIMFQLPPVLQKMFHWLDLGLWSLFYGELFLKLAVSRNYIQTIRRNWFLVLILLVPALRLFRLVRLARLLRILRLLRLHSLLNRLKEETRKVVYSFEYVTVTFGIIVTIAAFIIWQVERSNGGNITSFGDAMWWAIMTVTTVGYGDVVPSTGEGRIVASFLAVIGIVLFLLIAAKVTSLFVRNSIDHDQNRAIARLLSRIEKLEQGNRS